MEEVRPQAKEEEQDHPQVEEQEEAQSSLPRNEPSQQLSRRSMRPLLPSRTTTTP